MRKQSPVPEDRLTAGSPVPAPPPLVQTASLSKHYGSTAALDDCTLTVATGEVFGLSGPTGPARRPSCDCCWGFSARRREERRIGGLDVVRRSVQVRRMVAYLPGEVRLFRQMRREVLDFFSAARPGGDRRYALELAERLELNVSRRVAFMSTGMRRSWRWPRPLPRALPC